MASKKDIYEAHRKAMEEWYTDKLIVTNIEMVTNPETKTQEPMEVTVYENVPCMLEFMSNAIPNKAGLNFTTEREDLLSTPPDIFIKAGAKIKVLKQSGKTYFYDATGEVMDMETHNAYYLKNAKVSL